jgi:predicted transcriptional regulator
MSESYPFTTYSGLLEPDHYKRIGTALWLFLWCISSTTKEIERDGVTWGVVLGNKPMKMNELSEIFGVEEKTVRRWIKALEHHEYIRVNRAPYGLIFSVKKSKKFKERSDKNVRTGMDKYVLSQDTDRTEMPDHPDKNVRSNKDITVDITKNSCSSSPLDEKEIMNRLLELEESFSQIHGVLPMHINTKDIAAMKRVIAGGIPVPFIIQCMSQIYQQKLEENDEIRRFSYYPKAIEKAWQKELEKRSPVSPVPVQIDQFRDRRNKKQEKLPESVRRQLEKEASATMNEVASTSKFEEKERESLELLRKLEELKR